MKIVRIENAEKCVIGMSELKLFGFIISATGFRLDPKKVKTIAGTLLAQDRAQLRSFLESITYLIT